MIKRAQNPEDAKDLEKKLAELPKSVTEGNYLEV